MSLVTRWVLPPLLLACIATAVVVGFSFAVTGGPPGLTSESTSAGGRGPGAMEPLGRPRPEGQRPEGRRPDGGGQFRGGRPDGGGEFGGNPGLGGMLVKSLGLIGMPALVAGGASWYFLHRPGARPGRRAAELDPPT